jgi:hypothetical protein
MPVYDCRGFSAPTGIDKYVWLLRPSLILWIGARLRVDFELPLSRRLWRGLPYK